MQKIYLILFFSRYCYKIVFHKVLIHLSGLKEPGKCPGPKVDIRLETWVQKDSNSLTGKGIKVVDTDTTLLESIEIKVDQGHTWYIPTVPDQNNATAIPFKLVSAGDHHFVFENPQHDFPQRIIYSFQTGDAWKHFLFRCQVTPLMLM